MMKVSDWLKDSIDSHDIADSDLMAKDFTERTGMEP